MIPTKISGVIHYLDHENPITYPAEFNKIQTNVSSSFYGLNELIGSNLSSSNGQDLFASSLSNNSTSDEDHHQSLIDERKQRRMISNRESARRSRMRKQRHLNELWSQVTRLRNENHGLIDKLNSLSDDHDRVVMENKRLKEETSDLRQMLCEVQANNNIYKISGFGF